MKHRCIPIQDEITHRSQPLISYRQPVEGKEQLRRHLAERLRGFSSDLDKLRKTSFEVPE